jgi:hypothetical protein
VHFGGRSAPRFGRSDRERFGNNACNDLWNVCNDRALTIGRCHDRQARVVARRAVHPGSCLSISGAPPRDLRFGVAYLCRPTIMHIEPR